MQQRVDRADWVALCFLVRVSNKSKFVAYMSFDIITVQSDGCCIRDFADVMSVSWFTAKCDLACCFGCRMSPGVLGRRRLIVALCLKQTEAKKLHLLFSIYMFLLSCWLLIGFLG